MKANIETITPDTAAKWLEANTQNRTLKRQRIEQMASAIRRGEWVENGESIKFNGSVLIDGQHRLAAVVSAGLPIRSVVVRDLPISAQESVDTGVRRSLNDLLSIRGEESPRVLAAALNHLYLWRTSVGLQAANISKYPTHPQALRLLSDNPRLRESVPVGEKARRMVKAADGLTAFLHYIFAEIDRADADDFFEKFSTGIGIETDSAIFLLRKFHTGDDRVLNGRTGARIRAALFIKAWNSYRDGEPIKRLRFKAGGKNPDKFPEPH